MSSYNDCIKFSLNIKDPLLEFLDISIGKYRNRDAKFYHAVAHLDQCLNCGSTNIVHNGHLYSNVRYPALDASLPVFIRVAKQRVICRDCHMNSMAETELVEKYCCISNATKRKIIGSLTEDWSMKSIARQTSTSTNTVQRVLERYGYSTVEDTDWLPEYLAFDEFRGVGRQLHFIAIDGHTHKIVKVLPTRLKKDIINYFKRFPLTVRNKVKTVTMDLNYYYDIMAKELFPNAQVILDRFHIVQMLNRSFNSCRIQEMKKHKKGAKEYNLLKYYWKLYLKPFEDLEKVKPYHQPRLKDTLTQEQVVADGLRLSPELENTYNLMQDISKALRDRDTDKLKDLIKSKDHVGNMMHTTLNTFKRNLHDILNAAKFDESNGCLEGTNRKIKQIERTAYGYANFTHLITRIQLEEKGAIIKEKASSCSDPRNSDMNLEGFTMSKLTKKDKIHIFEEWTLENKRGTYLSKKYGIRREKVNYLINLIKIHGLSVLDKSYTHYSKEYKEHAIKRVLLGNESINAVALDLGLPGNGMLSNWIRSYKENGYNVVIKKKGRRIHEQERVKRIRTPQARKRQVASPEFKAYCRKRIYKKIGCLGSKKKEPTKTEIAQAVTELRHELGLAVKKIIEIINANEDLPHISRSNYYDVYTREDKDQVHHSDVMMRIREIYDEIKNRYVAPGYRRITHILHREGYQINRKTVNRLMRKMDLYGYVMKRRHPYSSYQGDIKGRIKPDLIKRKFFALRPNMKWYTDITEFNLRGKKLYLSPIIDGCGRDIVAYNISRHPNLKQVMSMLDDAFKTNQALNGLIFHTDRGWQYQHKAYQHELAIRGIEQSMSRKGCSPDDGLMEASLAFSNVKCSMVRRRNMLHLTN